jgi:hypothetical protein
MKNLTFLLVLSLFPMYLFGQNDNAVWKIPFYDLILNDFNQDEIIETEARLLQIIPTGKRRQSYVFVVGIFENLTEVKTISTETGSETVSFSKMEYKPVEFELWFDDGGDSLLDYLGCNTDLPDMYSNEEDFIKFNNPENQPCIGSIFNITAAKKSDDTGLVYFLLKVEK